MEASKPDIHSRVDIEQIVNSFYDKVKSDSLIGSFFAHVDWERHLPTMYTFWTFVILHEGEYRSNPLAKHMQLQGLQSTHFSQWLQLFFQTIDDNFQGPVAQSMKDRAGQIGMVFEAKLVK